MYKVFNNNTGFCVSIHDKHGDAVEYMFKQKQQARAYWEKRGFRDVGGSIGSVVIRLIMRDRMCNDVDISWSIRETA